ncbi:MAG: Flp pilus assembly complex ATPase component TadA [Sphingobacteriia bacterium]|nr:Flp pilus assembly complex ATPase component TadA [Sphingobacteriia bacterium]
MELLNKSIYLRDFYKYLQKYFEREDVTEIIINKPGEVFLETISKDWERHEDENLSLYNLDRFIFHLAAAQDIFYDPYETPVTSLEFSGNRIQVISGEYTKNRFAAAIRLNRGKIFEENELNFNDIYDSSYSIREYNNLLEFEKDSTFSDILSKAVESKRTILIAGATGTRKTTLLNALARKINLNERIITLEGTKELILPHPNWCSILYPEKYGLKEKNILKELLNTTLRMRPDRVIIGEIRLENACAFVSALDNGHNGTLATIHANSPMAAIDRIIRYLKDNGDVSDYGAQDIKDLLIDNIYGVVHLENSGDGKVNRRFHLTKEFAHEFAA